MPVKVNVDLSGMKLFKSKLRALDGLKIDVGVLWNEGTQRYPTESGMPGPSVAMVAAFNEFGTRTIPARPAMRRTAHDSGEIAAKVTEAVKVVMATPNLTTKREAAAILSPAAMGIARLMRRNYVTSRSWAVKNAPTTVALKGFDYPLYETGKLRDSIGYRIKNRRGENLAEGLAVSE